MMAEVTTAQSRSPVKGPLIYRVLGLDPMPVFAREITVWKKQWFMLIAGVVEPLLYLVGMGTGLGQLVGEVDLAGHKVSYLTFVAGALIVSASLNGALFDSTFNFYFKMKHDKVFEIMLYSPLSMRDILAGEFLWVCLRSTFYGMVLLAACLVIGASPAATAVLILPLCLLVALAFGALGAFITTFARTWHDLDVVHTILQPLFLCSTSFFTLGVYPQWAQPIVQVTPVYHAIALARDLFTGIIGIHDLAHLLYLVSMGCIFAPLTVKRVANFNQ